MTTAPTNQEVQLGLRLIRLYDVPVRQYKKRARQPLSYAAFADVSAASSWRATRGEPNV